MASAKDKDKLRKKMTPEELLKHLEALPVWEASDLPWFFCPGDTPKDWTDPVHKGLILRVHPGGTSRPWYHRYTLKSGVRGSISYGHYIDGDLDRVLIDYDAAVSKWTDTRRIIANNGDPRQKTVSLGEAFEAYKTAPLTKGGIADHKSFKEIERRVEKFIKKAYPTVWAAPAEDFTSILCRSILDKMRGKRGQEIPGERYKLYGDICGFMSFCTGQFFKINPILGMQQPDHTVRNPSRKLSWDEIRAIFQYLLGALPNHPHVAIMVFIALATGQRLGEINKARRGNVNLSDQDVVVFDRETGLPLLDPVTKEAVIIPAWCWRIPPEDVKIEAPAMLKRRKKNVETPEHHIVPLNEIAVYFFSEAMRRSNHDHLFEDHDGELMTSSQIGNVIKQAFDENRLPEVLKKFTTRDLRTTVSSHCRAKETGLKDAQLYMHHVLNHVRASSVAGANDPGAAVVAEIGTDTDRKHYNDNKHLYEKRLASGQWGKKLAEEIGWDRPVRIAAE